MPEPICIEYISGKEWTLNGKYHREDGPAIECVNGNQSWFINGTYHREDGPAIEYADGSKEWWTNGRRHREDGPAVQYINGSVLWILDGLVYHNKQDYFKELEKIRGKEHSNKIRLIYA